MPYLDKTKKKWRGVVKVNGEREQALFATKDEAKRREVERKKELERSPIQTPDDMELRVLFSKYLDYGELRFSAKVFKEKRELLQRLSKLWGGGIRVANVTVDMVATFLEEQAKQRSNNASNKDRKNLLALWNWGVQRLDLPQNPVSKTYKLHHDRSPQYTPPEEDMLKVLMATNRAERVFLNAYLQTAARKSEVFRWKWYEDINFEKREIRLGTRKTKDGSMKYAWLPMSEDLYDDLMWLWKNRQFKESPYVFVITKLGQHYGEPFVDRRRFLRNLCKRAEVRPFGYHAIRRFVASMLADKHKQSSRTIQSILRHEKFSTTELYIQNLNRDLRPAMNLLNFNMEESTPSSTPTKEKGVSRDD